MILVDTNVISELWKPKSSPKVAYWFDDEDAGGLFTSALTLAELSYGAHRLQEGRRRTFLLDAITLLAQESFAGRVLAFDERCADVCGRIRADRERLGRAISMSDAAIAATALTYNLRLATRNTRDFEGLGLDLINPFEA